MTDHFKPLWGRNVPKFGIAHAMALGVSTPLPAGYCVGLVIHFLSFNSMCLGILLINSYRN